MAERKGSARYILKGQTGSWMRKRGVFVKNITIASDVFIGDEEIRIRVPGEKKVRTVASGSVFTKSWPNEVWRDPETGALERQTSASTYEMQFVVRAVMKDLGLEAEAVNGNARYHSAVGAAIDALVASSEQNRAPDEH